MEGLRQLETKLTHKEAEQELNRTHPDFAEIWHDPSFHEWVELQPANIQNSLYKNNSDARAAAHAIDLYKVDTGKRKTASRKSAAQAVGRTSANAPVANVKMKFSESQVSQMTAKEFYKYEETISESMRNSTFSYDLSGAARWKKDQTLGEQSDPFAKLYQGR